MLQVVYSQSALTKTLAKYFCTESNNYLETVFARSRKDHKNNSTNIFYNRYILILYKKYYSVDEYFLVRAIVS